MFEDQVKLLPLMFKQIFSKKFVYYNRPLGWKIEKQLISIYLLQNVANIDRDT